MNVFTLNRAKTQGQINNEDIGRVTDDSGWAQYVLNPSLKNSDELQTTSAYYST